jgi:exodeoxyribonuclease VII small subunit
MTETPSTADQPTDASITDKQDRLESIIDQLNDGEVSLNRAKKLRDEGQQLLDDLKHDLDLGDGEIIERQ